MLIEIKSSQNTYRKSLRDGDKNEDIPRECDVEENVKIKKGIWFNYVEHMYLYLFYLLGHYVILRYVKMHNEQFVQLTKKER